MSIIEKAAGKLEKEAAIKAKEKQDQDNLSADLEIKSVEINKNVRHEVKHVPLPSSITNTKIINLDLEKLHQLGIVTPNHGKSQIAEQFRIIKRPLLKKAFSKNIKNGNLIMLTSSLPEEGKSFNSVNLAISIATEMDHRVLLIDADVARPSIPKVLGFGTHLGLLDILVDENLGVEDVMLKTNIEKLTIMSAGSAHPHATELLASRGMDLLLDELAQRYHDRVVIFDSPPLLMTSEARVLATQMGQIVLVVEAEKTTQQMVKETLRQIESCVNVDLIYNKAREFSDDNYFGYYYS
tara:strand:- start:984 stop:1871 length:888 start_codon:yes stop_codon:yes gene_type:complete